MSSNLVLAVFALFVAGTTLVVRYIVPPPPVTVEDPYSAKARRSTFSLVAFGLVPLLAGLTFLAAWWRENDTPRHVDDAVVVQIPHDAVVNGGTHQLPVLPPS